MAPSKGSQHRKQGSKSRGSKDKEPLRHHWEMVLKALELRWLDPFKERREPGECGPYGLAEFYDICKWNRR